ncbi:MAG: hypothetical protein J6C28_06545 [Bacilli bacterium]|nr:hypothetical protein [Bacilli bacterium]
MEHSRKQKLLTIIALVVVIASLSIGFAAFSTTLNISSSASVSPSSDTFKVKFSTSSDSLVEGPVVSSNNTMTTTSGVIDNSSNPTIKGISVTFTSPGEYAEFTFYARNEGEYTAYLNNINFLGEKVCTAETGTTDSLVQSACSLIDMIFVYDNRTYYSDTPITGHSLSPNSSKEYTLRFEYPDFAPSADGPFSISFPDIALVYSTIDDSSFVPEKVVKLVSGNLNDPGSIVSIGDEQFYVIGQEDGNVKLLSMYNLLVGNSVDSSGRVTALSNPTGIQDEDARGAVFDENDAPIDYPWIGTIACFPDDYKENYASYLSSFGISLDEIRNITVEELEDLGCIFDNTSLTGNCSAAPDWVYDTSYWTNSFPDSAIYPLAVISNGKLSELESYSASNVYGVRPVIIISTSEF